MTARIVVFLSEMPLPNDFFNNAYHRLDAEMNSMIGSTPIESAELRYIAIKICGQYSVHSHITHMESDLPAVPVTLPNDIALLHFIFYLAFYGETCLF